MTIEEILAGLQAIIDGAKGPDGVERPLTDEEVQRYEGLEKTLTAVRASGDVRKRNEAYNTPVRSDLPVRTGATKTAVEPPTEQERAFSHYLRTGQPNSDLVYRAQSEGSGAAGGYLVPDGFAERIIERLKAFGGISKEAEHIRTTSGNPLPWPTNDDVANEGEIVPENAQAAGGADLVFGIRTLSAWKYEATGVGGEPLKVSWELAQDSAFNLEAFVERKLAERIARKQARDWANGTGVGMPQGLLTGGTSAFAVASNVVGMTYPNFVAAAHVPDVAYREDGESVWLMSDGAMALAEGLVDSTGRPLLNMSTDGISGKPARSILGYRVVIDNTLPATFAAGAKTVVFGNVKRGYVIRDVKDVTIVVLRELFARTGQIGYMAWARADGLVQDSNAYTVISAA